MPHLFAASFGSFISQNRDAVFAVVIAAAWFLPSPVGPILRSAVTVLQKLLSPDGPTSADPSNVDPTPVPPPDISAETRSMQSDSRNIPPTQRY